MIDYYEPNIELTLLGAGFLAGYHVGAICLLTQIWPQKPFNRICGASCGGMVAALITAGIRLEVALRAGTEIISRMHNFILRPTIKILSMRELVEESMQRLLPENAHLLCKGKLGISLTKLNWSLENLFATEFYSKQDVIDAISAGCFIPLWSGSLNVPKFQGQKCIDGAYSDNAPSFKAASSNEQQQQQVSTPPRQVAVTPFSCEGIQVSPPDKEGIALLRVFGTKYYANWNNFLRSYYAMIPMAAQSYSPFILNGHRDMKEYVLNSNLVKCRQCYSQVNRRVRCSLKGGDDEQQLKTTTREACLLCLRLLEKVDSLEVSRELIEIMTNK